MGNYPEIIMALEMCSRPGEDCPTNCPYKLRGRSGRSCRATLCYDAMHALAAEENRADNLQERADDLREETEMLAAENAKLREELKNRPEVGFDADTFDKTMEVVKEADFEATYWHGYADALKWFLRFYLDAEEGGDDV